MKIIYKLLLLLLFHFVRILIDFIIYLHWNLYRYDLSNHDIISCSVPSRDIYAVNHEDKAYITATHIKKKFVVYELVLEDNIKLECADDHKVCTKFGYLKFVKDLKKYEPIFTKHGIKKVKKIKKKKYRTFMFDITLATEDKLFYTNDILSANSIISAIFIVWYILCHTDRNILCLSQSGNKVKELMDKISVILKGLPFYMKPGIEVNNIMSKVFDNGCKLVAETTTDKSGASFTIHLLYADEFALVHHTFLRQFYRTVYPTLSESKISRMIITSTPRGMNKFYEIYDDAVKCKNRFNPIRVDWYEVPARDEQWKNDQIADLGSEEDFNQEFGNQFLAGNKLLFQSGILKKIKRFQVRFQHRELEVFEDKALDYEGLFTWHPKFDMDNLKNEACKYVVSIDLADGNGGDYSVINIFQILPMAKSEIENLKIFTEDKDFFKLVQVGMFRSNSTPLPDLAFIFYHLITDVMNQECVKVVLEMNHEGNYFRELTDNLYGEGNEIESDYLYVRFKYNMGDEAGQATRIGINNIEPVKDHGCKIIKDKVKNNQMILIEYMTVEESLSFAKNKRGKYESQTGNDDCMMSCVNVTHYYETLDFAEQIDEILEFCPTDFIKLVDQKLNRQRSYSEEDDYADLL